MLDTTLSDKERYPLKLSDFVVMDTHPELAPVSIAWAGSPEYACEDLPSVDLREINFIDLCLRVKTLLSIKVQVMAIDPSGRGKDELGVAIVKQLGGNLYVLVCTGLSGGYSEDNLQWIAREKLEIIKLIIS